MVVKVVSVRLFMWVELVVEVVDALQTEAAANLLPEPLHMPTMEGPQPLMLESDIPILVISRAYTNGNSAPRLSFSPSEDSPHVEGFRENFIIVGQLAHREGPYDLKRISCTLIDGCEYLAAEKGSTTSRV